MVQPSVSERKLEQPSVSDEMKLVRPLVHECEEKVVQPSVSEGKLEQPSVSEGNLVQPRVSEGKLEYTAAKCE